MKTSWQIVVLAGAALAMGAGCASEPREARRVEPVVQSQPASVTVNGGSGATPKTVINVPPPVNVSLLSLSVRPGVGKNASALNLSTDGTDEGPSSVVMTGVRRVTFAEEGADFDPCVSRDGSTLVFASTQHRNTSDIYFKKTDSRVVTQLTNDPAQDAMPAISPDGQSIAFASDRSGNWDIYVMPIAGGRAVQVTNDLADDVHPSWSPDGRSLVFSRQGQASGRWEMWVAEVANPAVSNFIGYGVLPQWSPVAATGSNGSDKILFQLGRERGRRSFSLWTVEVSNGTTANVTEIASSAETALIDASWSPDGQWVVYTEVPVTTGANSRPAWATLWMISSEGEGKVRLTDGTGLALSPVWGGNDRLFFVSDRSGKDNIWSLDLSPAVRSAQAALNPGHSSTTATAKAQPPSTGASDPVANGPASIEEHKTASESNTDH